MDTNKDTDKILIAYFDDYQYIEDYIAGMYEDSAWFKEEIENLVERRSMDTFLNRCDIPENIQNDTNLIVEYIIEHKDELRQDIGHYMYNEDTSIWKDIYEDNINSLTKKIEELNKSNSNYSIYEISGTRMGWRNRSGEKFATIENGSDFIKELVSDKISGFSLYVYMENEHSNFFDVTLSPHDSPTGEFYKVVPYVFQHRKGDIIIDSEEYGKVKIIETYDAEVQEYDYVLESYKVEVIETGDIQIIENENIL